MNQNLFLGIASAWRLACLALSLTIVAGCASLSSGDAAKLTRDEATFELSEGDKALRAWQFRLAEGHYSSARELLRKSRRDARSTPAQAVNPNFNPQLLDENARFYETAARELAEAEAPVEARRERLLQAGEEAIAILRTQNDFLRARDLLNRLALQAGDAPSLYQIHYWHAQTLLASYDVEEAYQSIEKSVAGAKRFASVALPVRTPVLEVLNFQAAVLMRMGNWDAASAIYLRKSIEDKYRDWEWRWMSDMDREVGLAQVELARAKAEKISPRPHLGAAAAHLGTALKLDQGNASNWTMLAEVEFLLGNSSHACDAAKRACELGQCAQKDKHNCAATSGAR